MQGNPNHNVATHQAIKSKAHVADVSGTGKDCKGHKELLALINVDSIAGAATASVILEESTDDGAVDTYAAWTGSTFTTLTASVDDRLVKGRVRLDGLRKRYIRARLDYTGNGTDIAPLGVTFVLFGARNSSLCNETYDVNTDS